MSLQIVKNVEDYVPAATNTNINECYNCRRPEATDRMKLIEMSSQVAALDKEEAMLKSLHRRLEMRIKRFLHRTRNSIAMQEKLLNMEKRAHNELITRKNLIATRPIHQQEEQQLEFVSTHIERIQENNIHLQKEIASLCVEIQQIEKDRKIPGGQFESTNNKAILIQTEDRLHRMNLELNTIRGNNSELRATIAHMQKKRREMIDEYDRLSVAMQNATNESRQLTFECSESFGNRRNLVARMRTMRNQHERDEKKLLDDIRELDRLLESNQASKNFILYKSNLRREQIRINELLAGKRSSGAKSAYTADEFRRLFCHGFGEDFVREKVLNRAVETFLDEQDRSFAFFEYAVELINELDYLRENLDKKRKHIATIFADDNVDSLVVKDVFSMLERSVNEAGMNVQSLASAKENGRELLNVAYQLLETLFVDVGCETKTTQERINDRNILLYLAGIESRVQQLLITTKTNRRGGGFADETTVSWRTHHPSINSFLPNTTTDTLQRVSAHLHELDSLTPQIPLNEEHPTDEKENENPFRTDVINAVLNTYSHRLHANTKDHAVTTGIDPMTE